MRSYGVGSCERIDADTGFSGSLSTKSPAIEIILEDKAKALRRQGLTQILIEVVIVVVGFNTNGAGRIDFIFGIKFAHIGIL